MSALTWDQLQVELKTLNDGIAANLAAEKALRVQRRGLEKRREQVERHRTLLLAMEEAEALIADAKTNPNCIYLWEPRSKPGDPIRPEETLEAFFGGLIPEEKGYFVARARVDHGEGAEEEANWEIGDETEPLCGYQVDDEANLREVFGVTDREAWEASGGQVNTDFFLPDVQSMDPSSEDIINANWDWDCDEGRAEGRYYYPTMWFTLLPSAQGAKVQLKTFDN